MYSAVIIATEHKRKNKVRRFCRHQHSKLLLRRLPQPTDEKTHSSAQSGNTDVQSQNQGCALEIASFETAAGKVYIEVRGSKPCAVFDLVWKLQGSVLGLFLFSIFINDLPYDVSVQIKLFEDNCVVHNKMKTKDDQIKLNRNLQKRKKENRHWCDK